MSIKKTSQNRSWMVTLSAEKWSKEKVQEALKNYTYIGQLEKGDETDYLHWQIYIENKNPIKFSTLKNKLPEAHLQPRWGSKKQCYGYVTKLKTAIPDTLIENGEIDMTESASPKVTVEGVVDMMKRGMTLDEVLVEYPSIWRSAAYLERVDGILQRKRLSASERPLKAFYLYGEPGTGKSTHLTRKYGFENVYRVTDYKHPFDSYSGEPVLILDEFYDSLPFGTLLTALEGLPFEMPARYNNKWAAYEEVWIVSNRKIQDQYSNLQFYEPERFNALLRRIRHNFTMVDYEMILDNYYIDSQVPPEKRQ